MLGANCIPLFPQNITSNITFNNVTFELNTNLTIGVPVSWKGVNSTVRCESLGGLTFEEYDIFIFSHFVEMLKLKGLRLPPVTIERCWA